MQEIYNAEENFQREVRKHLHGLRSEALRSLVGYQCQVTVKQTANNRGGGMFAFISSNSLQDLGPPVKVMGITVGLNSTKYTQKDTLLDH
jgi:hypothetical protein